MSWELLLAVIALGVSVAALSFSIMVWFAVKNTGKPYVQRRKGDR